MKNFEIGDLIYDIKDFKEESYCLVIGRKKIISNIYGKEVLTYTIYKSKNLQIKTYSEFVIQLYIKLIKDKKL